MGVFAMRLRRMRPMKTKQTRVVGGGFGLALILAAALAAGCAGPRPAPRSEWVGRYQLVSVDGQPVPCTVKHQGRAIGVQGGGFVIEANGNCRSEVNFTDPSGRSLRRVVEATGRPDGETLRMKWKGAGVTTGTVQGDEFVMHNEGMVFSYRRQTH